MRKAVTEKTVEKLKSTDRAYVAWDTGLPGFGVKVTPTGRKVYVVQYRVAGLGRRGLAKRITLGAASALTVDEARRRAKRELGLIADGADPAAARASLKATSTVAEIGTAYLDTVRALKTSESADYERRRLWKRHIAPAFGKRLASAVTAADVRRLHLSLSKATYVADRVVQLIRAVFKFAAEKGGIQFEHGNPARGVDPYHPRNEQNRERFLTVDEVRRLGDALRRAESVGLPAAPRRKRRPKRPEHRKHVPKSAATPIPANPVAIAAIRLLATTGCREQEILSLRWDAVDLETGHLRLKRTKTGRSDRPLADAAATILRALPRVKGNPFVLPSPTLPGEHMKEIRRTWEAVRYAAGLGDVRLHDLRHSHVSWSVSAGATLLVAGKTVGHKDTATTARYAHLADGVVRMVADRTAADIVAALNGTETAVTPLRTMR